MSLKNALIESRISYRALAEKLGMSASAVNRMVNRSEVPAKRTRQDINDALAKLNLPPIDESAFTTPQQRVLDLIASGTGISESAETAGVHRNSIRHWVQTNPAFATALQEARDFVPDAVHANRISNGNRRMQIELLSEVQSITEKELQLMQLDRNVLGLFGLRSNPFLNDVETDDDVFVTKGYDQVSQSIRDAIVQRGFIALCAPSGAGKTTIWDGIESEFANSQDTVLCKIHVKNKEVLAPGHLCRALIYGLLGNDVRVPSDAESQGRMLSTALRSTREGSIDRKAVLFIDDAHFCSTSVLRQLKTFFEEKVGRFRLLTIVLVGLPTLKAKLAEFSEIGNRIRLVEVPPVPVKDYLNFKLRRMGSSLDKLFDPSGFEAFEERFRQPKRAAVGYPLIINATVIRAMVKLYENGAQPGERISREIIDSLPGVAPIRKVTAA